MKPLFTFLDTARDQTRAVMRVLARRLDRLSHGRITPNQVTIVGLLMHVPIAWLIAVGNFYVAAIMLTIFGLFDCLDGELARVQNKTSNAGMLLDASTDRFKEVILYGGVAYNLASSSTPVLALWATVACGASICVSYVKAKGETAVAGGILSANQVNRLFQDGLFRFEVRMALLVFGLLSGYLALMTIIIAIASSYTACQRLVAIMRKLNNVQS